MRSAFLLIFLNFHFVYFFSMSPKILAQKEIYVLQKEVKDSNGKALGLALKAADRTIQLEACHLAATWGEESHLDALHGIIQYSPISDLTDAAIFAIGQIGNTSSINPIQHFITKDAKCIQRESALCALAKCMNPNDQLPRYWIEDDQLTAHDLNAMAKALVFVKCDPRNWLTELLRISPALELDELSRLYLAAALGKSNFKLSRQEELFVHWLRGWYEKENAIHVRVKLHRILLLSGQIDLLAKDALHKNTRLSFSACAQLTQRDSSEVFRSLPLNWKSQCANSFVKSWIEIQFNQIDFDQIRTILNQENWTVDEKVILAKAWNREGHIDAQNAILFRFFETENTIERMQWARCMKNSYNLLDSLVLSLESFEPAVQYAIAETALGTGEYLNTPGQYSAEENVLLHANDFGVQSLVADFISSNHTQFIRNQELIDIFKSHLSHLNGDETIETKIALIQALGAIDSEHVYVKPMACTQPFPSYKTWRKNKKIRLRIHTSVGNLVFCLDGWRCPMTVANMKQLARQDYFENIAFHRVIPEFVAQAGCTRGDGMSGLNSVINSEFSGRIFSPYAIGMASAGKNTESAQFFITLADTPHLNGRYTQFGILKSGKRNVHKIHMGTKIIRVR